MTVSYVKIPENDYSPDQHELLQQELGVDKLFVDKTSNKTIPHQELQRMINFVREDDTVIVESYSSIACSVQELLDVVKTLHEKGVNLIVKKEDINTAMSNNRFTFTVFAGLHQFWHECMSERQAEGIQEAQKAGKYRGRKPAEIDTAKFKSLHKKWRSGKITAAAAQKQLGLSPSTFYRRVREYEVDFSDVKEN